MCMYVYGTTTKAQQCQCQGQSVLYFSIFCFLFSVSCFRFLDFNLAIQSTINQFEIHKILSPCTNAIITGNLSLFISDQ